MKPQKRCAKLIWAAIMTLCNMSLWKKARWPGTGKLYKFFGYSHDEVVDRALATVESAAPGRKITLVAHDWGAFAAYAMIGRRPELFERAVMFDIGLITPKLLPKLSWLVIGLYQWWLALAFVVSQVLPLVGTLVGDAMLGVFPWRRVGPRSHAPSVSGSADASCPEVMGTAPHASAFISAIPDVSGLSLG